MKLSTYVYGIVVSVALAAVAHVFVFHDMRHHVEDAFSKTYSAHLSFLTTLDAVKDAFVVLQQNLTAEKFKEVEERSVLLQALVKRLDDYGNVYFAKNAQSFNDVLQSYLDKLRRWGDDTVDRNVLEAEIRSLGKIISTQLTFVERTQLSATESVLMAIPGRRSIDGGILIAIDILCVLIVSVLAWCMRRAFRRDIPVVQKMLERLKNGDLSSNPAEIHNNELGRLIAAGNEVGENFKVYVQKFYAASAALEDMFDSLKVANIRVNEQTATSILSVQRIRTLGAETLGKLALLSEQLEYIFNGAESTVRYLEQTHKVCDNLGVLHAQVERDTGILRQTAESVGQESKFLEHVFQEILSNVKGIDELGEQTKLLSLNATIEAKASQENMSANFMAIAREIRVLVQSMVDAMRVLKAKFNDGGAKLAVMKRQVGEVEVLTQGLLDSSLNAGALFEGQRQATQEGTTVVQVIRHAADQSYDCIKEVQIFVKEMVDSVDGMQRELKKFEVDAKKTGHYVGSVQQVGEELRLALRSFNLP